jgi:hypothetical protein
MSAADSSISAEQLMSVAATAAEVMALGNQLIDELVASGGSLTDIATDIARLQAVSVGQVAVDSTGVSNRTRSHQRHSWRLTLWKLFKQKRLRR